MYKVQLYSIYNNKQTTCWLVERHHFLSPLFWLRFTRQIKKDIQITFHVAFFVYFWWVQYVTSFKSEFCFCLFEGLCLLAVLLSWLWLCLRFCYSMIRIIRLLVIFYWFFFIVDKKLLFYSSISRNESKVST